jgi:hypothetical protein
VIPIVSFSQKQRKQSVHWEDGEWVRFVYFAANMNGKKFFNMYQRNKRKKHHGNTAFKRRCIL